MSTLSATNGKVSELTRSTSAGCNLPHWNICSSGNAAEETIYLRVLNLVLNRFTMTCTREPIGGWELEVGWYVGSRLKQDLPRFQLMFWLSDPRGYDCLLTCTANTRAETNTVLQLPMQRTSMVTLHKVAVVHLRTEHYR